MMPALVIFVNLLVHSVSARSIKWDFHSGNSCNLANDIHLNASDEVSIEANGGTANLTLKCTLVLKLADKNAAGMYIEFVGGLSCQNTLYIVGLCDYSKNCEEVS